MLELHEVAIGVVIHGGQLTSVVRQQTHLHEPTIEPAPSAEAAAIALLRYKYELRRASPCDPVAFVEANHLAGRVVEALRKHDTKSRDQLIEGAGPAKACAPGGVEFANWRSELIHNFLHQMHGDLLVPPSAELSAQLLAFERGERDGKICYPPPTDVADKLGRYPATFIAAVLATIPAPPPGAAQTRLESHDPYAALE